VSLNPEFIETLTEELRRVTTADVGPIVEERGLGDLGLDSVALMELLSSLEEKMNKTISDRELSELRTFGDLQRIFMSGSANHE
jgi:acyl carrier protein